VAEERLGDIGLIRVDAVLRRGLPRPEDGHLAALVAVCQRDLRSDADDGRIDLIGIENLHARNLRGQLADSGGQILGAGTGGFVFEVLAKIAHLARGLQRARVRRNLDRLEVRQLGALLLQRLRRRVNRLRLRLA